MTTSITVTGTEQVSSWDRRTLPPVERLPAGLWSVPVPIPQNPLRYTLSYLVPGTRGPVVVDPGWDTEAGWEALGKGVAAAGAAVADIEGVVVTHVHPDHHGLSERVREASGAWIAMHPAERDSLPQRAATSDPDEQRTAMYGWLRGLGASDQELADLMAHGSSSGGGGSSGSGGSDGSDRSGGSGGMARPPSFMAEPDVLLADGDLVPGVGGRLRAIWTPGHTPGHLCLQDAGAKLLLTGDHLLPRITPNVGLHPGEDSPVLADFLASLDRTAGYDDHEALPAHEYRFSGMAARVGQLRAHHSERCRELVALVLDAGEITVWELTSRLTWSRPWAEVGLMKVAAVVETMAHIRFLVDRGDLERVTGASQGRAQERVRPGLR